MLQKEYPGFGDEFVIFPGPDGEDVYGYLKEPDGRFIFDDVVAQDIFFTIYNRFSTIQRTLLNTY
nr:unnamed protein product [Callosobruchus analis]